MREAVIASAVRTPLGSFNGTFATSGATNLGGMENMTMAPYYLEKAQTLDCTVMFAIGAQASAAIEMKYILVAPIWAVPRALKKEGIGDVDLFEINEAFSGSTCAVMNELNLDPAKTNIAGGSVALGHPIGASGCRVKAARMNL